LIAPILELTRPPLKAKKLDLATVDLSAKKLECSIGSDEANIADQK